MSSTRYAEEGSQLRPDRYSSSVEYRGAINAYLAAKRIDLIDDLEMRDLLWFVQSRSLQQAGLKNLANACATSPERLTELCCDPEDDLDVPWQAHRIDALRQNRSAFVEVAAEGIADTEVSRLIFGALELSYYQRELTLVEGASGLGKSATAKAFCDSLPGLVRYVEVPSSNDDRSFYVAIAEALGVASGETYNTQQVKLRVEKTLRLSGIMLVLDEAQYLWPQVVTPRGIPARMLWVKMICDAGVSVALLATPSFTGWKHKYIRKTLWDGDQFDGRLSYPQELPLSHSLADLEAIARVKLPGGNAVCWKMLAGLALILSRKQPQDRSKPDLLPAKNARAIEKTVNRAIYIAKKAGREVACRRDVEAAIAIEFPGFDPKTLAAQTIPLHDRETFDKSFTQAPQHGRKQIAARLQTPVRGTRSTNVLAAVD